MANEQKRRKKMMKKRAHERCMHESKKEDINRNQKCKRSWALNRWHWMDAYMHVSVEKVTSIRGRVQITFRNGF